MNSRTLVAGTDGLMTIVLITLATSAMGVKSSTPLKGMPGISVGFIACVLIEPISSV
jgi:hypothetical protein